MLQADGRSEGSRISTARAVPDANAVRRPDGVTILTIFILLLLVIPSGRTIPALGSAGSVALLWGVGAGVWWCGHQLQRKAAPAASTSQPARTLALLFAASVIVSYIAAMLRALPPEEANPADTGIIRAAALVGILLVAADGPPNLTRLEVLLRRITALGALYALLGLVQFISGHAIVDQLPIPGLTALPGYESIETRGGMTRPLSTATHPLEYSLVLAAILPIALAFAVHDPERGILRRWTPAVLIGLAMALSSSRSAFVGLAIGMLVLLPTIGRRGRITLLSGAVLILGMAYLVAPSALTNVRYLFTAVSDDSSAASRTESYSMALEVVSQSPVVGRGFGTFLPQYRIFDNEYLLLLVEIGIVGTVLLLAVAVASVTSALRGRSLFARPLESALGGALAASVAAGAVMLALFDALSFPQAAGIFFLVLGLSSSYWRLAQLQHPIS